MHFKFSASISGDKVNNQNFTVEAYDKNGSVLDQASGRWKIEEVGEVRAEIDGVEQVVFQLSLLIVIDL